MQSSELEDLVLAPDGNFAECHSIRWSTVGGDLACGPGSKEGGAFQVRNSLQCCVHVDLRTINALMDQEDNVCY